MKYQTSRTGIEPATYSQFFDQETIALSSELPGPLRGAPRIDPLSYRDPQGELRESNSGPRAPEARIIPLDQAPCTFQGSTEVQTRVNGFLPSQFSESGVIPLHYTAGQVFGLGINHIAS
eukprot:TRINITY_DN3913_c0_g1_i2.p1 TRINITY_DN3913_c0_g1~~TRINITY_DN3913_c0_g1_i2.p1  ORF type:complete len:120 (-),score=1.91 TRINITY_DN3913_c0_g1_i2:65-424(-)